MLYLLWWVILIWILFGILGCCRLVWRICWCGCVFVLRCCWGDGLLLLLVGCCCWVLCVVWWWLVVCLEVCGWWWFWLMWLSLYCCFVVCIFRCVVYLVGWYGCLVCMLSCCWRSVWVVSVFCVWIGLVECLCNFVVYWCG